MKGEFANMVEAKTFETEIIRLLDVLYESQKDNMEEMAKAIATCIENDGVVHVFGTGHSVGMGIDIKNRLGSLVPIHIMETNDFVLRGGVSLAEFHDKVNVFERRPNIAENLYKLYNIHKEDIFIIISNSGINGMVIDIANLAKKQGHKVIVVTSMKHTTAENSRHPSGKKLYEFGDIVIDNCGPHGDALLATDGVAKICSVSSICNNMIAQAVAARVIELLAEKEIDLPILTKDEEHNKKVLKKYEGRV